MKCSVTIGYNEHICHTCKLNNYIALNDSNYLTRADMFFIRKLNNTRIYNGDHL